MITKPTEQQQQHHKSLNNGTGVSRPRKRTHLTTGQIASLQASFANNPLPDAAIRHGLSLSLGITERTVQIWFQNRRAKARKMEEGGASGGCSNGIGGKSNAPGGSSTAALSSSSTHPPRYQATFRSMMTPQLFEEMKASSLSASSSSSSLNPATAALGIRRRPRSASKPEKPKPTPIAMAPRAMSEENDCQRQESSSSFSCLASTQTPAPSMTLPHDQSNLVSLPVHLLRIGAWTRFANNATTNVAEWGLVCYCTKEEFVWQIQAEGQQFRIHLPLTAIHQLSFGPMHDDPTAAQLDLQVDPQQLMFTMCLLGKDEWVRCGDFSEEQQASRLFIHEIQGHHDMLQQALMTLLTAVPELAPKLVLMTSPLLDDLCRDFTMSPSATPEPSMMMMNNHHHHGFAANLMYPNHHPTTTINLDKSMILQPFYYSPSPLDDQQLYDQMMML